MATETTRIRLATGLYALLEKKALHHISVRDIAVDLPAGFFRCLLRLRYHRLG